MLESILKLRYLSWEKRETNACAGMPVALLFDSLLSNLAFLIAFVNNLQREKESEKEGEIEIKRQGEREKKRVRNRERERKRERDRNA